MDQDEDFSDVLSDDCSRSLPQINQLDGYERKRFLKSIVTAATRDFSFIDAPVELSQEQINLQNSILTVFTLATKLDIPITNLIGKLGIQEESLADLSQAYDDVKQEIHTKLARYGHDIPWVTGVNWRLSSVLRSSGNENLEAGLVYKVTFEGTGSAGRAVVASFDCTLEELVNLSSKFKEIERNCHQVAENKHQL